MSIAESTVRDGEPRSAYGQLANMAGALGSSDRAMTQLEGDVRTVSLVIPARNEARNIGWVLDRVPEWVDQILLVVPSADDNTVAAALALRSDIDVVVEETRGKGAALRAGFSASTGDYIVMLDADGSMDPREIARYIQPLHRQFDLIKGSRFMPGGGSTDITPFRQLGNRGLLFAVNFLYRSKFTELCYGFFAFRRCHLAALNLQADGFEIETELVVSAVKAKLRIGEVPSMEAPRMHGTSNLKPIRDGQRVLKTLLKERFTRHTPMPLPQLGVTEDIDLNEAVEVA